MNYVFDLDGTLANCEHRMHHIKPADGGKKNWKAFFDGIKDDTPVVAMCQVAQALILQHNVLFCTGRPETHRSDTEKWIADNLGIDVLTHQWPILYMRGRTDNRKDYVTKADLADRIIAEWGPIDLWFDDRREVIVAIRAKGIQVCAVADND